MAQQKQRQHTGNDSLNYIPSIKLRANSAFSPTLDYHICQRGTSKIGHLKSYILKEKEALNVNICSSPNEIGIISILYLEYADCKIK